MGSKVRILKEWPIVATPSNPDVASNKLFPRSNNLLYELELSGTEEVIDNNKNTVFLATGPFIHFDDLNPNTFTNAVTTNLTAVNAGNYILHLSFNYNCDVTNSDIVVRATFGGNAIDGNLRDADPEGQYQILRAEIKDAGAGPGGAVPGTGSGQKYPYYMPFYIVGLTAGATPELIIDVGSEAAGIESSIWNVFARLEWIQA